MVNSMKEIVDAFYASPKWQVSPPTVSTPNVLDAVREEFPLEFPDEVYKFYALCNGLEFLGEGDDEGFLSIEPVNKLGWAVPTIFGRDKYVHHFKGDILYTCFVIGRADSQEFFLIDLGPARYGYCYFAETYFLGQKGWMPFIASSFSRLLEKLLEVSGYGEYVSWQKMGLPDAYEALT